MEVHQTSQAIGLWGLALRHTHYLPHHWNAQGESSEQEPQPKHKAMTLHDFLTKPSNTKSPDQFVAMENIDKEDINVPTSKPYQ